MPAIGAMAKGDGRRTAPIFMVSTVSKTAGPCYRSVLTHRPVFQRLSLWAPPVSYMVLIFWLSAAPAPLPDLTTRVWDKLLHLAEYGALALFFCRALLGEEFGWRSAVLGATVLTSLYGATDELHQLFNPARSADIQEWVADTLGGAVGALVYGAGRIARTRSGAGRDPFQ
jgi:VanZ family protein